MWFWLSLAALLLWSGSDLFSKIGCVGEDDKLSHLKMVMAVGLVMGLHAAYEIVIQKVEISLEILWTYLPVSLLYIGSMAVGYLGLRYIELSISSPICNSSGALVAVLCLCTGGVSASTPLQLVAVALVCLGVIGLGVVEMTESKDLRERRQAKGGVRYSRSLMALMIPVIYCLLDALGTFADSLVLTRLSEDSANVAYELTFLVVGVLCAVYVLGIRREKLHFKKEVPKYIGACFETAGQFAYINALADSAHVAFSAPIISSYCAVSVLWSRLFLKERLSVKHYVMIGVTVVGIALLGLLDEMA